MQDTDPKLAELREAVGKAILDYINYHAPESRAHRDPVVAGWVVMSEYTTMEMYHEDSSASMLIVPADQHASTSRGLFGFGMDAFSR